MEDYLFRARISTRKKKGAHLLLAAFMLTAVSFAEVYAGLDTSFGTGGKVVTDFGLPDGVFVAIVAAAMQPDNKTIIAGFTQGGLNDYKFVLARYNTNGSLDTSFGSGGKVITDFAVGTFDGAYAIALQPDGGIVAAGEAFNGTDMDFAVVRYTAAGNLDPTFGNAGKVVTPVYSNSTDRVTSVAVQPDAKIVVGGFAYLSDSNGVITRYEFALARYYPDGSLDTTFGNGGKVLTTFPDLQSGIYDIAVQADGKIVAAGYAHDGSNYDFALARCQVNGTLDTGFGSSGLVRTDFTAGSFDVGYELALQADGKIVVAGDHYNPSGNNYDFALARYNANGSLDTSFSGDGKVTTNFGADETAYAVAIDTNGRIVVAGKMSDPNDTDFALARYTSNGSLDTRFDGDGRITTDFNGGGTIRTDIAHAVLLQTDGKIVAAGWATSVNSDAGLARYLP